MPVDVMEATAAADLLPELLDGFLVHAAALSRGLDVTLLPRQLLMVNASGAEELSFIHGVPESSTLAAVTFAHDKRMRRALLVEAGLPIPKGGAYSIGHGVESSQRLIRRVGYPIVVKPAVGDSTVETHRGITNEAELKAAIDYFWTPSHQRPAYVRAAYGLTDSRELEERDGKLLAPAGTRVLVEQEVSGEYLRCLVIAGQVRCILSLPGGPWASAGSDVTAQAHPSVLEIAAAAAAAVPGLAIAAVDLVAADGHGEPVDQSNAWIVEVSERPWLAVPRAVSAALSEQIANAILADQAAPRSIALKDPVPEVTVDVHIEGIPDPDGAQLAVTAAARRLGVRGQLAVTDAVGGTADGILSGSPADIAWITESLLDGRLEGHRAMLVAARHRSKGGNE